MLLLSFSTVKAVLSCCCFFLNPASRPVYSSAGYGGFITKIRLHTVIKSCSPLAEMLCDFICHRSGTGFIYTDTVQTLSVTSSSIVVALTCLWLKSITLGRL